MQSTTSCREKDEAASLLTFHRPSSHNEQRAFSYLLLRRRGSSESAQRKKRTITDFFHTIFLFREPKNGYLPLLFVLLFSVFHTATYAQQQDPTFGHYFLLEPAYNPAAAGRTDKLVISTAFQTHAAGYEQAGNTMYAAADMAFLTGGLRHGVGAAFMNDRFGLFSFKRFSLQYSHHLSFWKGTLSLGGQMDMVNMEIDGTKADLETSSDPSFPTSKVNGSRIDASAGIFYQRGSFYAGLSAHHLTAPLITMGEVYQYAVKPIYFFTAGYNIKTRLPFLSITPSVFTQYNGVDWKAALTGRVAYYKDKKHFYGGCTYTPQHSLTAFIGGTFHGIELGYAYEAFTSDLGLGAGQHEVTLRYHMDLHLTKRGKNKHKSVRWL